jgi:hypothetical protein
MVARSQTSIIALLVGLPLVVFTASLASDLVPRRGGQD